MGRIDDKNRSTPGVRDICSYEWLRPIDSSSQSGNFLKQIEYNPSPNYLDMLRDAQTTASQALCRGKGRKMGIGKFGPHLSDSFGSGSSV